MEIFTRNKFLALGSVLLLAFFCLAGIVIIKPRLVFDESPKTTEGLATGQPDPKSPSSQAPTQAQLRPTSTDIPIDSSQEIDQIEGQVISLRSLEATGDVELTLYSQAQMREHVINDLLNDYTSEEARDDAIVMATFGLLNQNFDLYDFYVDLYSEQVAGFYDFETKQMYVIQGESFHGPERLTFAHEYAHALQDQAYDIQQGLNYNDQTCETEIEHCKAVKALFEGDALLVEVAWYQNYATQEDRQEIRAFYQEYEGAVFDQAPAFIQQDFFFPYEAGFDFVNYLFERGGWEAVNQAYRNLPVSSEQILHPERYPADIPVPVDLPEFRSVLGEGWKELARNVRGEWATYLTLAHGLEPSARLPDERARQAVEGWGGDEYVVYYNSDSQQTAMVLQTAWESDQEAREFAEAFRLYTNKRFGEPHSTSEGQLTWVHSEGYTEFHREGEKTTWILAPTAALGKAFWEQLTQTPSRSPS